MKPADLILECLRRFPQKPGFPFDSIPAEGSLFWDLAEQGGVAVLVARQLGHRSPRIDQLYANQLGTDLRIRSITQWLLATLEGAGIAAAPLKGPFLAERIYAESSLRPTSDVDVLIASKALPKALRLLEAEGAVVLPDEQPAHHHASLTKDGVLLELHFLATTSFGTRVASEPLLGRASRAAGGTWLLDPIDELLFLAVHAASHRLRREVWLLDLKMLGQSMRDGSRPPDWEALEQRAREWEALRPAGAALLAASDRTGMDLSGMSRGWQARGRRALRKLPNDLTAGPAPSRRQTLNNVWAQVLLSDSTRTRLRLLRQKVGRLRSVFE